MTEVTGAALLDLDTLIERPRIAIDGTMYEILSPHELSVMDSRRFTRWGRQIDALGKADAADEAEEAKIEVELEALVAKVARKICVGVPDDVFAKVPGQQRWQVIDVFTALLLRTGLKVAGAMVTAVGPTPEALLQATGSTGASWFPGSSGSTAESRRTGWRRFLPRW